MTPSPFLASMCTAVLLLALTLTVAVWVGHRRRERATEHFADTMRARYGGSWTAGYSPALGSLLPPERDVLDGRGAVWSLRKPVGKQHDYRHTGT